jgi:hypothetical protein
MTLKDKEVIMKVTVKDGIKGFSGKLSFGGTASAGTMRGVLRLHKLLQTN